MSPGRLHDPAHATAVHPAAIVVLVIAAGTLVAVGAAGAGLILPPVDPNLTWVVRLVGGLAAAAGLAALLYQRRRLLSRTDRHYDPAVAAFVAAASIMGTVAALALLGGNATFEREPVPGVAASQAVGGGEEGAGPPRSEREPSGFGGGFGRSVGGDRSDGPRTIREAGSGPGEDDAGCDWRGLGPVAAVLLLILLLATVAIALWILRRRWGEPGQDLPDDVPVAAADAEAGLRASLDEVAYTGHDPRGQITAAYRRLLVALAEAGAPRQPQEAPYEHLRRALGPLAVDPAPMHRLAELFVIAQFSDHPVTDGHRAAAAEALESALAHLRAAEPVPEVADA
jgi:hypothetical protein